MVFWGWRLAYKLRYVMCWGGRVENELKKREDTFPRTMVVVVFSQLVHQNGDETCKTRFCPLVLRL